MKKIILYIQMSILCILIPILSLAAENHTLDFQGISGDALKNVQARLAVSEQSAADSKDFLDHAPEDIRKALEPFGYFKVKIDFKTEGKKWIFSIEPGPRLTISDVKIRVIGPGKDITEFQTFLAHPPLITGQVFLTENYNKTKEALFQIAHDQGYLKANLEKKEIRINLKTYTASITLLLNTGPRYYFGHVLFGSSPFAPEFLQRFVSFKKDEPFSSEKLMKFQQDLRSSHFFREVEATPNFDAAKNDTVPINVNVVPQKSQRYDVGIGYGTYTGARFTLGTEFRRVTDTGQHFNAQLKLSSVLSALTAKYYIPGHNPMTDQYVIGSNIQYFAPKNGSSFSQSLSASYDKKLTAWQRSISINYLNERYRVNNDPTHISQIFYPSLTFSCVKTDNVLFTRQGSMINFIMQGASQDLFSRTSFFQTEAKGKYIFSPTQASRVIVRADFGYTAVENLNQLPLSLRYFAGGLGSVRGYPLNSIGPGKFLEVGSIEVQHRIVGNWNGALFYDAGNASNRFNGAFKRGQGAGVVYQSFLGPVQFYVGRAMSKPGKPYSIEFSIGPDF
ncbi:MAG: autotransporter assembly complex protein TamA [Gammaproteobacteria bacterium]